MKTYKANLPEIQIKYKKGNIEKVKVTTSLQVSQFLRKLFNADTINYSEECILLLLNRVNTTIGFIKISSGGTCGTVIDPKIVFIAALKSGASSLIIAHNHPSGNLMPSNQDILLTKNLVQGGRVLQIPLLDHLIITDESYYSFADEGAL